MGKAAPAIVILFLWSYFAFASYDLSLGGSLRSYPLSGVAELEAGDNFILWGAPAPGNPFYGYIRPKIWGDTAATYNSAAAVVDLFPLSFLGARAGGEAVQNDTKYTAYNCVDANCLGRFYRTFFEAEVTLGAGPVFVQGKWRRERWSEAHPSLGDFIEPTSGFSLMGSGESETVYQGVAGVKISPELTVMGGLRFASSDSREHSRMPFGLLKWNLTPVSIGVGGGYFESDLKKREITGLLVAKWEIWPSLELK